MVSVIIPAFNVEKYIEKMYTKCCKPDQQGY